MRVTCPKCQLKGLVDTGPLMLQTRVLCVRCATSYEAVPVGGLVETLLPSSNGHAHAGQGVDWNLLETGPMPDEPLELPGPVSMEEPLMQTEYVLEDLLAVSTLNRDVSLPLTNFAPAHAESTEEESTEEEILSLQEDESFSTAGTAQEETAWPDEETALPSQEALPAWPSEEDEAWPTEEHEALSSEETVSPSGVEVSSETEVSSESEAEVSSLYLVAPSIATSSLVSSSSFEAEVLPASETEQHDSLLDVSQAPDGVVVMDEQPVGFVHTAKDVLPYADKNSLGVRLMRVSPVWLLGSGLLFISLIFAFNWATKPNAQANNLTFDNSLTQSAARTATQQPASNAPAQAAEQTNVGASQNPQTNTNAASPVNAASSINDAPLANAAPAASPAQVVNNAPAANPATATNPAPATNAAASAVNTSHAVETKTEPIAKPSQVDSGSGNFTVQVGSYSDSAQADERAASLRSAGFDARIVPVQLPKRGTWYRVQAGRFGTREEATRYGQQLRTQKLAAETIITETQNQ
jgi:cell division protein FtsN